MSAMNNNDSGRGWLQHSRTPPVQLYLSDQDGNTAVLVGTKAAGFLLNVSPVAVDAPIDPSSLNGAAAGIVEVAADNPKSIARFSNLASRSSVPLIAAAYNPPLALVRALVRAGAHDVVPLPLDADDLETSLAPIRDRLLEHPSSGTVGAGKVVSVIKSVGGIGATSLLGQLGIRSALNQAARGRDVCLIDLDVQFGDAAFQLGLESTLSLVELLEAGSRLDGEMLRATTLKHQSGLNVIGAPPSMMPLESLSSDQVLDIVELATRQFGLVYVDLPSNWTNWSLSLLARSDLVLLVTEISVASLNRARRQIELIRSQDLKDLEIRVVANRYDKGAAKTIKATDIRQALGRDVSFTIANEPQVMRPAIDRGVPIDEIKRKSAVGKDIGTLADGVATMLGMDR
ncbi:MAG: CpaE family protein [Sphingomicrobium sp.]